MSFLLDPFLLILSGIAEVGLCKKILCKESNTRKVLFWLSLAIIVIFWSIAGALYLDIINMPGLGEYGYGNHFMWNSGVEIIGLMPFIDTSTPTYANPIGLLNILAVFLFLIYPLWLYFGVKLGFMLFNKKIE